MEGGAALGGGEAALRRSTSRPKNVLDLYAGSLQTYVSDLAAATRMTDRFTSQMSKLWLLGDLKPYQPSAGGASEPEPEAQEAADEGFSVHVQRTPMLWLRHGMLRRNAATVVTLDDGDGVVKELYSREGAFVETEIVPLQLGARTAQLTIRATRLRSMVPGAGTYTWDYGLMYTDDGGGEISAARPGSSVGGAADDPDSWWPELNQRVNLQSSREGPKYVDGTGLSQGNETAVEYEVRVRVGGKVGGIRARAEDLSVDGPAFMSNSSFMADRGANMITWRRFSDFHNLHMDLLSCFVGSSASVLKGIPGMPPKTWRPTSGSQPAFIEARRAKLEEFMRKVLTSPMIDARRNPYVLQFLGLAPPPFAADPEGAASEPVYRPLVVRIQAPKTAARGSAGASATSAEHRAAMHKHYKSSEGSAATDAAVVGAAAARVAEGESARVAEGEPPVRPARSSPGGPAVRSSPGGPAGAGVAPEPELDAGAGWTAAEISLMGAASPARASSSKLFEGDDTDDDEL